MKKGINRGLSLLMSVAVLACSLTVGGLSVRAANYQYQLLQDATVVITGYEGGEENLVIPDTLNGYTVTQIGSDVFRDNATLKSVQIPDTVKEIGSYAFSNCQKLEEIRLPSQLYALRRYCFLHCDSLTSIALPDGVKILETYCLSSTGLTEITIPDSVEEMSVGVLASDNALVNVTLPSNLEQLPIHCFYGCTALKTVALPSTLKGIGDWAFSICNSLEALTLPEGLERIGNKAFSGTPALKELIIPSTVNVLDGRTFNNSGLEKLTVLSDACTIENDILRGCSNTVIYGHEGSTIQQYAAAYQYEFQVLNNGSQPPVEEPSDGPTNPTDPTNPTEPASTAEETSTPSCLHIKTKLVPVKRADTSVKGKARLVCRACGETVRTVTLNRIKTVKLSRSSYKYTGDSILPSLFVKDASGKTVSDQWYRVTYISRADQRRLKSIKAVGQYIVKVHFTGCYQGEQDCYLSVKPADVKITSVKRKGTTATVRWKKARTVSGFELTVAENKAFTKGKRTLTVSKADAVLRKVKKLKKGKTYYFRLRSYKNIKVNGVSAVMYSDYSAVKKA